MSSAKRLAREILDTRRLALGHATSPQLTSSALDGGQLDINDSDGNRIGGIGLGDDGGFVIDYSGGPKPPKPSPPTVTADAGMFRIEWDGSFVNEGDEGILATSDTDRVEIHASMDENFVPDRVESFGGAFATLDGGSFTLGPLPEAGTYYFRLVARSKSAQFSEPSDRVEQTLAITSIDLEVIDAWLTGEAAQTTADGKNSIWRGPDEPAADPDRPFKDGDIWFEMNEDGESIPNIYDETAGGWVSNRDARQSAIERVQEELRQDLDAVITDGSGTKNFYQPTAPLATDSPAPAEGDLWFDTSEGGANTVHVWTGGEWVSMADARVQELELAQDTLTGSVSELDNRLAGVGGTLNDLGQDLQAVEDAQAQLNTDLTDVMTSVDGKNTITWNPSAPSKVSNPGKAVGDLWYRTSGNSIVGFWKWDGTDWVTQLLDKTTIPLIDIGAGTFGSLKGVRLEANSVSVDKLIVSPNANLISDSSFQADGAGWNGLNGGPVASDTTFTSVPDGPSGVGTNIARVEPSWGDLTAMTSKSWPRWVSVSGADKLRGTEVVPGDSFRLVLRARWVQPPTTGTGRVRIRGGFNLNGDNNQWPIITGNISSDGVLGEWRETTGTWSHPGESELRNRLSISVHVSGGVGGIVEVAFVGLYAMAGSTVIQDGAVSTQKLTADVLEVKNLKATSGQLDEAVINKLFSDVVVAKTSVANAFIGENAILTGAVTAAHMKTGTITAESGVIGSIDAGTITVGEMNGARIKAGTIDADTVLVKGSIGSTLIENGAVTTEKIKAGAITAESGIIGSIDANVITVGKIMGNQLDADAINGKTITGATIRTASSGSRVELTHNGLKQYNSLGATIVDMTAGSFTLQGGSITGSTIKTANSGSRVEINTQGLKQYNSSNEVIAEMVAGSLVMRGILEQTNSIAKMQVGPAFDTSTSPGIRWDNISGTTDWAGIGTVASSGSPALTVQGPGRGSAGSLLVMMREYARLLARDSSGKSRSWLTLNEDGGSYFTWSHPTNSGYSTAQLADRSVYVGSVDSKGNTVGTLSISASGTMLHSGSGNLSLEGSRVQSSSIYNTNTSAAPVYINTTGSLGRGGSSSIRYKQDISAGRVLNSILDIEPAQWRYRNEIEAFNEAEEYRSKIGEGPLPLSLSESPTEPGYHYGAIAEQVAELDIPELVRLDEYGRPDGLRYELFGMALIPIVKQLRDRIEELEAQLSA